MEEYQYDLYLMDYKGHWISQRNLTLEEIEFEINNNEDYIYYMLIGIDKKTGKPDVLAQGDMYTKDYKLHHKER